MSVSTLSSTTPRNGKNRPLGWLDCKYPLVKQLKKGGMASVEVRKDLSRKGRLVAVKKTHPSVPHKFLEQEFLILTEILQPDLDNIRPDIVAATDYFFEGETNFMLLRYEPGGDLRNLIDLYYYNGRKRIEQAFLWHAMASLACALAHVHKMGVVHRDIKPGNIFLRWYDDCPRGEDYPDLVLGDFGIAADMNCHTYRAKSLSGTPAWQPPERPRAGPEADVWALGAVIHALAHEGLPPISNLPTEFRGNALAVRHWWEQPQSRAITPLREKYSDQLEAWVHKTLRFDPRNRITSRDLERQLSPTAQKNVDKNFRPLREFARYDVVTGKSASGRAAGDSGRYKRQ